MHFNPESVLEELNGFEKTDQDVPPILEEYLEKIAKSGDIMFPWSKLKPLLKRKMDLVITDFCKSCPPDTVPSLPNTDAFDYESLKKNMLDALDMFQSAPFTIQRLCELITNPKQHYNRTDKYMRGLEKNLLIVSTVDSNSGENDAANNGSEPAMVNGGISNSSDAPSEEPSFDNDSENASPPVNGTVLENFATVFPSATRIANPSNNIQVTIVTGSDTYQTTNDHANFDYVSEDNTTVIESENFDESSSQTALEVNMTDTTSADLDESSSGDKLVSEETNDDQAVPADVETNSDSSAESMTETVEAAVSETAIPVETVPEEDDDDNNGEPDSKRRKLDESPDVEENEMDQKDNDKDSVNESETTVQLEQDHENAVTEECGEAVSSDVEKLEEAEVEPTVEEDKPDVDLASCADEN